jgi:hypothetical protein
VYVVWFLQHQQQLLLQWCWVSQVVIVLLLLAVKRDMPDDKSVASCGFDGKSISNYSDDASWMVDKEEEQNGPHSNIARRETTTVWKWKLVVVFVLVAGTIGAALAVSCYTHDSEIEKFRSAFAEDAAKVSSAVAKSLEQTVGALDVLAATLVSHAAHSNQSWPQVTLPDFAIHASKVLPSSNALYLSVLPLVTSRQRVAWERYAGANDAWVNESMRLQETWSGYHGPVIYDWVANPVMHNFEDFAYNTRYLYKNRANGCCDWKGRIVWFSHTQPICCCTVKTFFPIGKHFQWFQG